LCCSIDSWAKEKAEEEVAKRDRLRALEKAAAQAGSQQEEGGAVVAFVGNSQP